jgi:hypothetical protein
VPLETLDHQILRLQIACCAGGVPCAQLIVADLLVRDDQRGDVILLRQRRSEFLHLRNLRERAQASDGVSVQCANTLGDFIDRLEKVFILFLKGFVKCEKVGTLDIPMRSKTQGCLRSSAIDRRLGATRTANSDRKTRELRPTGACQDVRDPLLRCAEGSVRKRHGRPRQ